MSNENPDRTEPFVKQLLAGRDHAVVHPMAAEMRNLAYLVGCSQTGECLLVDPTWAPEGLLEIASDAGIQVVGAIVTHAHPDHVGGSLMGMQIPGVAELVGLIDGPIHTHSAEAAFLAGMTGVPEDRLVAHSDRDVIMVGQVQIEVLHAPGHSPGGICLFFDGHLITGDVLFVGACGRLDLPGADPAKMYESLQRLTRLPGDTVVLPGHDYGPAPRSTIADEIRSNPYLQVPSRDAWMAMMR